MKAIMENFKLILTCVTSLIAVVGIGWYAYAYLQETYLEEVEFKDQCVLWESEIKVVKEEISGVKTDFMLQKYQTRIWQLEQWIRELESLGGPNCQNCSQRDRQYYWDMKKEHDWLRQEIRKITGYGG